LLAAFDATVILSSRDGNREVAVSDFLLGPYWVDRRPDELLIQIRIPAGAGAPGRSDGVYLKLQLSERPTVGVAVLRRGTGVRVAIGAVAGRPLIVDVADPAMIDIEAIIDQLEPTDDLSGSLRYKRHVTAVYLRRAMAQVAAL
jgi:carbon-monoxide dehydrogenase medium subunit